MKILFILVVDATLIWGFFFNCFNLQGHKNVIEACVDVGEAYLHKLFLVLCLMVFMVF